MEILNKQYIITTVSGPQQSAGRKQLVVLPEQSSLCGAGRQVGLSVQRRAPGLQVQLAQSWPASSSPSGQSFTPSHT